MSTMNWNWENLDLALNELRRSLTVQEAVDKISRKVGVEISCSALRKALKRNGYDSPSHYLMDEENPSAEEVEDSEEGEEPDWTFYDDHHRDRMDDDRDLYLIESKSKHRAYWRRSDNQYVFAIDYSRSRRKSDGWVQVFDIPAKQIQWICEQYTYAGKGKTQKTICREIGYVFDREMQHETFVYILQALGVDKNSLDVAPHRLHDWYKETAEEIVSKSRVRKEAEVELKKRSTDLDWYKAQYEKTVERVHELGDVHQLFEDVLDQEVKAEYKILGGESYGGSVWSSYVSDLHFGKVFRPEENSQYMAINKEVLISRTPKYIDALEMAAQRSYGEVEHVLYQGLGDNFEAIFANMRRGQYFTMDSMGFEQYMLGIETHVKLIKAHLEIFPHAEVTALFIGGNHDRMMADKAMNSELFVNAIMSERIAKEFADEPRVKVICGAPVMSISMNGYNFISQHGHLNSWEKNSKRQEVIGAHGLQPERDKIVLSEGHFHQTQYYSGTRHTYYRNSSWCGPDDFAVYNLNKTAPAECAFLECTEQSVIMHGPFVM